MIKKMIIISLAVSMLTHANGIESEIGINIGLDSTKNDDGSKFENPTMGMTYQNNSYVIKPRFDLEYVKIKNDQASAFLKGSANAVYEYENKTYVVPYVLAGVGYEYVSDPTSNALESHAFIQGGAGLKVDLDDGYKVGIEGKYLEVIGSKNNEGNEIIVTAGLTIPIGTTEKKVIHKPIIRATPKPLPVIPIPIVNTKPKIVYIDENTCSIKISQPDLDRDGISDVRDQCPSTPCDFKVDYDGCPVKATLKINFATNSARIQEYSMHKVDDFTNFLLTNKGSFVQIVGHTDSRGSSMKNTALSQRRANSVMNALINRGVSASRLSAIGRGENMPLASNNTVEGRALNRRIEAVLTYNRWRR